VGLARKILVRLIRACMLPCVLNLLFSSDDRMVNFSGSGNHVHRCGYGNLFVISCGLFTLKTLAPALPEFFQWHDLPINGHATLQTGTIPVGFISFSILQKKKL
jgi:hypothetical protein